MNLEIGDVWEDRSGHQWRIISVTGPRIAPVSAGRWEGKAYHSRTFQRDGHYWPDSEDRWDLVRKVVEGKEP